jgi:glycosyltransferase involved in cell wall biosynthesis
MSEITTAWPDNAGVVIPAYLAADSLKELLPELLKRVPSDRVCVVDDGSRDETADVCRSYQVKAIVHQTNRGKGAALITGFRAFEAAGLHWAVTMDADGQHRVDDLDVFMEAIDRWPDAGMVIGARKMRPGLMPPARIVSNRVTSAILSAVVGTAIADSQCGYRAYAIPTVSPMRLRYRRFETETEVIMRACHDGWTVRFVPIQTVYSASQSHISHLLDTLRWVRAVVLVWLELRSSPRHSREAHARTQTRDSQEPADPTSAGEGHH